MKKLHYPIRQFKVKLKNGEEYVVDSYCNMKYSIPEDKVENTYSVDEIQEFIKKYSWNALYDITWKFKKYIQFYGRSRKIILDNIMSIEVFMKHEEVQSHRTIKDIGNDLPYEQFLQFVFDKEQELKSVITSRR